MQLSVKEILAFAKMSYNTKAPQFKKKKEKKKICLLAASPQPSNLICEKELYFTVHKTVCFQSEGELLRAEGHQWLRFTNSYLFIESSG